MPIPGVFKLFIIELHLYYAFVDVLRHSAVTSRQISLEILSKIGRNRWVYIVSSLDVSAVSSSMAIL